MLPTALDFRYWTRVKHWRVFNISALTLLTSMTSQAQVDRWSLEFQREEHSEACPDEVGFSALVASKLGYELPRTNTAQAQAHVRLSEEANGYVGTLKLKNENAPSTDRVFRGRDCSAVASSVALALALTIDPLGRGAPPLATPSLPPLISPPEPSEPRTHEATPKPQKNDTNLSWLIHASARGLLGALPAPGLGAAAGPRVRRKAFSAFLELEALFAFQLPVPDQGGGIDSRRFGGRAGACFDPERWIACVQGGGGAWVATGDGLPGARATTLPWAVLGLSAGGRPFVSERFSLLLQLAVEAALVRATLRSNEVEVWKMPVISASLSVTGEWRAK